MTSISKSGSRLVLQTLKRLHKAFGRDGETVALHLKDLSKSKELGYCEPTESGWRITVDSTIPEDYVLLLLVHEYAHAMTPAWEKEIHGPAFGVAYAAAYRFVFENTEVRRHTTRSGPVTLVADAGDV